MLIIPAIDLKDGCVVRFVQGRKDKKVYSKDPLKTAKHWARQGARLIHIVDLDGAFSGKPQNFGIVKEIVKNIDIPVQFGGGVRSLESVEEILNSGIHRVVLGTKAVQDSNFLKKAFSRFKEKIIVSVDTFDGKIMVKGWSSAQYVALKDGPVCASAQYLALKDGPVCASAQCAIESLEFINLLKKIGFKEIIYTDISKDGTLKGPNIKDLKFLLKQTCIKIIASGGISGLEDIKKLKNMEKLGLSAVIVGKALYEGKFTLTEALKFA